MLESKLEKLKKIGKIIENIKNTLKSIKMPIDRVILLQEKCMIIQVNIKRNSTIHWTLIQRVLMSINSNYE